MESVFSRSGVLAAATAVAAVLGIAAPAVAQKEIVIGAQCDRTGATQTVGVVLCPGSLDYVALINSQGGVEGRKIRLMEIDNEYKVPQGIEAYERHKKEGAVSILLYGTPHTQALTAKLAEDKIPGSSPGFGSAAGADGKRYPYLFPIAATYWSQATAAVKFVKDQFKGDLKGKKIAYLFYDNPAGKEPLPILEDLAKMEGFTLKTFAVPAPGVEMGPQVLDISDRFEADFVITHLFGRSPSVSIKEFKRVGFKMSKVIALVWGSAEADLEAAGGAAVAEGYNTIQFAGVGTDYQVHRDIADMYKKQGRQPPKEMNSTVYYNRGIFHVAVHIEAIRNALKAKGANADITGEDVKNGMEKVKGVTLGGLMPPLELTPADHEGGGWVQIFTVKGGKLVKQTDWFRAYPELLKKHIEADAKKS
jgi:branched-chain amino acid transport system substrate-binding protein